MRIIDQTPFFSEKGEISMIDRAKAIMKFGPDWIPETEAQKNIIPVLETVLDNNYNLLRNVLLPGLDIVFPLILVGPAGVYLLYVTHLRGTFHARGDAWGSISGNTFKPASTNLLKHTASMARALHLYLQRKGFDSVLNVEPVLLCADPDLQVDSLQPMIRIIMRDSLERYTVSIMQARGILTSELVRSIVGQIQNPLPAQIQKPTQAGIPTVAPQPSIKADSKIIPTSITPEEKHVPPFSLPDLDSFSTISVTIPDETIEITQSPSTPISIPSQPEIQKENQESEGYKKESTSEIRSESSIEKLLDSNQQVPHVSYPKGKIKQRERKRRKGFTAGQWFFIIFTVLIEVIIIIAFFYIVYFNYYW